MQEATVEKVPHAALLQSMTDEAFLEAWHNAISQGDEQQITSIEGNARHRFGAKDWRECYVARYPDQTRYQIPPKAFL